MGAKKDGGIGGVGYDNRAPVMYAQFLMFFQAVFGLNDGSIRKAIVYSRDFCIRSVIHTSIRKERSIHSMHHSDTSRFQPFQLFLAEVVRVKKGGSSPVPARVDIDLGTGRLGFLEQILEKLVSSPPGPLLKSKVDRKPFLFYSR